MPQLVLLDKDRRHYLATRRACERNGVSLRYVRTFPEVSEIVKRDPVALVIVDEELARATGYSGSTGP